MFIFHSFGKKSSSASVDEEKEEKQHVPKVPREKFSEAVEQKISLITDRLDEVMGENAAVNNMGRVMSERDLSMYWGTACTGQPHVGYFVPMSKIADFLQAGCQVTILFADLHAYLDNMKAPWELLRLRTKYYEAIIKTTLESIGVPLEKLKFVVGTDFQLSKEYTLDMYKMAAITSGRNALKAGAEVVKQSQHPPLSGMLYPLLQALDEEHLQVDAQFGGVDQRKIFALAEEYLPKIGYKKRVHLMNPMVPGLHGSKMSSSEAKGKIDLLDSEEEVNKKVRDAFAEEGKVEDNGLLAFCKMVIFPIRKQFTIERPEKFGGNMTCKSYQELEDAYAKKLLFPLDLKNAVAKYLNGLLQPLRQKFYTDPELIALTKAAYPETRGDWTPSLEAKAPQAAKKPAAAPSKAAPAPAAAAPTGNDITRLEIRVGTIVEVDNHPSADRLYVEKIDFGSEGVKTIVSGLREHVPIEEMKGRKVLALLNMKPSKLVGVVSEGMVLAASKDGKVELVDPPAGAVAGERVTFEGFQTYEGLARANEKVLKAVMPELRVNNAGTACYQSVVFQTSAGPCVAKSLKDASIG